MSYFKSITVTDNYGWSVENTPMNEQRFVEPIRLVGVGFDAAGSTAMTPDTNFWSGSLYNGANIYQVHNQVILSCSVTANSSASFTSVRVARYVGSYANRFRSQVQLGDAGQANNLRSWGMYTPNDGVFFELSGTTLNIVTRKTGVDSRTGSANWNLSTTVPTLTDLNTYEIYVTHRTAYFVLNDTLVHKYDATADSYADTLHFPVRLENKNFNSATVSASLLCRVATISRLGPLKTQTQRGRLTSAGQYVMKTSPARLERITINTAPTAGGTITIYDDINGNTAANIVAVITAPNAQGAVTNLNATSLQYGIPLANGLTVVSMGSFDVSVIYE